MSAPAALQRLLIATVVEEWAATSSESIDHSSPFISRLISTLHNLIASGLPSNILELQPIINRLRADCVALHTAFSQQGKVPPAKLPTIPDSSEFTFSSAQQVEASYSALLPHVNLKPTAKKTVLPQIEERYRTIENGIAYFETTKTKHERMVLAALGGAVIAMKAIPAKMTPLIRSVTNSIKVRLSSRSQRSSFSILTFQVTLSLVGRQSRSPGSFSSRNCCLHRLLLFTRFDPSRQSFRQTRQESLYLPLSRRDPHSYLRFSQIFEVWDSHPRVPTCSRTRTNSEGNQGEATIGGLGGSQDG